MRDPLHRAEGEFGIRSMDPDHIPFVVAEHLKHFPDGFFARLGSRFLARYCSTYLTSPYARGYIAEASGQPIGFLVGVTDPVAHRRHVLDAHGRGLLLHGVGSLALRPRLTLHFIRTRLARYLRRLMPGRRDPAVPGPPGVTAVLAYVVVVEQARSMGVGAALVGRFIDAAEDAGCARVSLVTPVGDGGAGPYYERRGWLPRGQNHTPDGRLLATYDFPLGHHAASGSL